MKYSEVSKTQLFSDLSDSVQEQIVKILLEEVGENLNATYFEPDTPLSSVISYIQQLSMNEFKKKTLIDQITIQERSEPASA